MRELKSGLTAEQLAKRSRGCEVSAALPSLWAVELDLLIELDRVCRKLSIPYFLHAGTLLGAVRHGGFIPWDDDLDVAMRRNDYDRFCRLAPGEFRHPYCFQDQHTDPRYPLMHAKVRNSLTTAILNSQVSHGKCTQTFNQGVFVDVFPLDGVPDDPALLRSHLRELSRLKNARRRLVRQRAWFLDRRIVRYSAFRDLVYGLPRYLFDRLTGRDSLAEVNRRYDACIRRYEGTATRLASLTLVWQGRLEGGGSVAADDYASSVDLQFEGLRFPAPAGYERVLADLFGDWRTPVRGTAIHGSLLVDVDRPYADYVREGVTESDRRRMRV